MATVDGTCRHCFNEGVDLAHGVDGMRTWHCSKSDAPGLGHQGLIICAVDEFEAATQFIEASSAAWVASGLSSVDVYVSEVSRETPEERFKLIKDSREYTRGSGIWTVQWTAPGA